MKLRQATPSLYSVSTPPPPGKFPRSLNLIGPVADKSYFNNNNDDDDDDDDNSNNSLFTSHNQ